MHKRAALIQENRFDFWCNTLFFFGALPSIMALLGFSESRQPSFLVILGVSLLPLTIGSLAPSIRAGIQSICPNDLSGARPDTPIRCPLFNTVYRFLLPIDGDNFTPKEIESVTSGIIALLSATGVAVGSAVKLSLYGIGIPFVICNTIGDVTFGMKEKWPHSFPYYISLPGQLLQTAGLALGVAHSSSDHQNHKLDVFSHQLLGVGLVFVNIGSGIRVLLIRNKLLALGRIMPISPTAQFV